MAETPALRIWSYQVFQAPDYVAILHEYYHEVRIIPLDERCYVVCLNVEEAKQDQHNRGTIVAALEKALAQGDKALVGNKGFRRFLKSLIRSEIKGTLGKVFQGPASRFPPPSAPPDDHPDRPGGVTLHETRVRKSFSISNLIFQSVEDESRR